MNIKKKLTKKGGGQRYIKTPRKTRKQKGRGYPTRKSRTKRGGGKTKGKGGILSLRSSRKFPEDLMENIGVTPSSEKFSSDITGFKTPGSNPLYDEKGKMDEFNNENIQNLMGQVVLPEEENDQTESLLGEVVLPEETEEGETLGDLMALKIVEDDDHEQGGGGYPSSTKSRTRRGGGKTQKKTPRKKRRIKKKKGQKGGLFNLFRRKKLSDYEIFLKKTGLNESNSSTTNIYDHYMAGSEQDVVGAINNYKIDLINQKNTMKEWRRGENSATKNPMLEPHPGEILNPMNKDDEDLQETKQREIYQRSSSRDKRKRPPPPARPEQNLEKVEEQNEEQGEEQRQKQEEEEQRRKQQEEQKEKLKIQNYQRSRSSSRDKRQNKPPSLLAAQLKATGTIPELMVPVTPPRTDPPPRPVRPPRPGRQDGGFLPCLPCLTPLVAGAGVLGTGVAAATIGTNYSLKSSSKIKNNKIERKDEYNMNINKNGKKKKNKFIIKQKGKKVTFKKGKQKEKSKTFKSISKAIKYYNKLNKQCKTKKFKKC